MCNLIWPRHCGISSEQKSWERWQNSVWRIAIHQKSRAVLGLLDLALLERDTATEIETAAWDAFCTRTTPRAWCAWCAGVARRRVSQ